MSRDKTRDASEMSVWPSKMATRSISSVSGWAFDSSRNLAATASPSTARNRARNRLKMNLNMGAVLYVAPGGR